MQGPGAKLSLSFAEGGRLFLDRTWEAGSFPHGTLGRRFFLDRICEAGQLTENLLSEHTVNTQSTYSQPTVNIQSTYSQHTVNITYVSLLFLCFSEENGA